MNDFAGWSMPIQYTSGSVAEHRLVRSSCGMFDVSHMGRFVFRGEGTLPYLNTMITSNLAGLSPMESAYGLLCREDGGVLDDVFVYRLNKEWLVVVNAANAEQDRAWLTGHLPSSGVEFRDVSEETAMIAFQGPNAIEVLNAAGESSKPVSVIPRFGAAEVALAGISCTVGRTGYTGEDGAEIFVASDQVESLWTAVLDQARTSGIEAGPIGLAARDSLRFEPGFPLYGHELSLDRTPIPARLKWACDLPGEFIGAAAIRDEVARGSDMLLATVTMVERGVPRQGQKVLSAGAVVGEVASGMYAPTVDAYCANVFVDPPRARVGVELEIEIRDRTKKAVVVKRPLYRPAYRGQ